MKKVLLASFIALLTIFTVNGQELKIVSKERSISVDELPTYIIISSKKDELFGDIAILIDSRNSYYEDKLEQLQEMLHHRKQLKIRNQSDLLNAMDQLGFDFVTAYPDKETSDDMAFDDKAKAFRVNMVFKKKSEFTGK